MQTMDNFRTGPIETDGISEKGTKDLALHAQRTTKLKNAARRKQMRAGVSDIDAGVFPSPGVLQSASNSHPKTS